ncbi:FxLD family lanthipeptide [Salinactinospora qingdaonensis]
METPTDGPLGEFDLDVSTIERGVTADELLQVTGDGCGHTCESACNTCP